MHRELSVWGLSWMTSITTEPSDRKNSQRQSLGDASWPGLKEKKGSPGPRNAGPLMLGQRNA